MKKISFNLASAAESKEIYNFLIDLKELSTFKITMARNIVEISNIPDFKIEEVILLLVSFFRIGIVYDCNPKVRNLIDKSTFIKGYTKDIVAPAFDSTEINGLVTKFIKNLHSSNIMYNDLVNYLNICINDLSAHISVAKKPIFSVGDIVKLSTLSDFYFEFNSSEEYVFGLICDIPSKDIVCIVPIISKSDTIYAKHVVSVLNNDIIPELTNLKRPTAMIDYVRFISPKKLEGIYSKASCSFLVKVLKELATLFSFTNSISNDNMLNNSERSSTNSILMNVFESTLEKIPKELIQKDKIIKLLTLLNYSQEPIIVDAFLSAYKVKKITYDAIINNLQEKYPYSYKSIMNTLKFSFDNWATHHPEVIEACPRLSILSLIKFFVRAL